MFIALNTRFVIFLAFYAAISLLWLANV